MPLEAGTASRCRPNLNSDRTSQPHLKSFFGRKGTINVPSASINPVKNQGSTLTLLELIYVVEYHLLFKNNVGWFEYRPLAITWLTKLPSLLRLLCSRVRLEKFENSNNGNKKFNLLGLWPSYNWTISSSTYSVSGAPRIVSVDPI